MRINTRIDPRCSRRETSAGAHFPAENRKTVSSAGLFGVTSISRQCITDFTKAFAFEWSAAFRTCSSDIHTYSFFTYVQTHISCTGVRIFSFLCRSFSFIKNLPKRNYIKKLPNTYKCPTSNFSCHIFLSYYSSLLCYPYYNSITNKQSLLRQVEN